MGVIGLGIGDGTGEGLEVGSGVVGSLFGLNNGIGDGTAVVGSLVGAWVGKDEGIGLGGVEGISGVDEVGTVVEGSLFGLGAGITVGPGDKLGNNIGCGLGMEALRISLWFGLGMLGVVVCGAEVVVSSAGPGVRGAGPVSNFVEEGNSMDDDGENGTGGVGCLDGAGVGAGKTNGIELGTENGIVDGLEFGNRVFVGVGVGAMNGIRIGEGRGIDQSIEIFVGDDILGHLKLGDGIIVCLGDGLGNNVGFGLALGVLGKSVAFGLTDELID